MFRDSAIRLGMAALLAIAAVACANTPTAPSATAAPAAGLVALEQLSVPVPAPLAVNPPAVVGATRFVAFGDSITFGVLSSFDGATLYDVSSSSYPVRLQLGLQTYHPPQSSLFRVINQGRPGETAATYPNLPGGVDRIDSVLTTNRPQVLVLLEGINDIGGIGASVDQTATALQRIVDISLLRGVPVIIATMYQTYETTNPITGVSRTNAFDLVPALNQRIRQIATRQNVYLADLYPAFGTDHQYVGGDGLHPTEDGFGVMASVILSVIEQRFPVRGSFQ
jgi:lysophospholipase L1-like esterase